VRPCSLILGLLLGWTSQAAPAYADGAARDLSGYTAPGVPFTVSILIDPPAGTIVCGLEESPPPDWEVSNISSGGTWDARTLKVKWGPFFSPSIPAMVTYDVGPPPGPAGRACFSGKVVFDGLEQAVTGDECVGAEVPTLSGWGLAVSALILLVTGTVNLIRRRPART